LVVSGLSKYKKHSLKKVEITDNLVKKAMRIKIARGIDNCG
jgi:hypothetical protein